MSDPINAAQQPRAVMPINADGTDTSAVPPTLFGSSPSDAMLLPLRSGQRRVAVLAVGLGGVGFAMTLAGALFTDTFSTIAFQQQRNNALMSLLYIFVPAVTLGLYGLLLFYGGRLTYRIDKPDAGQIRIDLGRVRMMCAPLLVAGLLTMVLGQGAGDRGTDSGDATFLFVATFVGLLCAIACCVTLLAARRAHWDLAAAQGASFSGDARFGFQVLVPSPVAALPAAPVDAAGTGFAPGAVAPASPPPPSRPVAALPALPAYAQAEDDAFRDWEAVFQVLLLVGLVVLTFRVAPLIEHVTDAYAWRQWERAIDLASGGATAGAYSLGGPTSPPPPQWWGLITLSADLVMALAALGWVTWAIVCLTAGPRWRRAIMYLCVFYLALTCAIVMWSVGQRQMVRANPMAYRSAVYAEIATLQYGTSPSFVPNEEPGHLPILYRAALESVIPMLLLVLMRRPQVRQLFGRRPRRVRASSG